MFFPNLKAAWFSLLIGFLLAACTKNEFSVDIKLAEDVNEVYSSVYYASDPAKGWLVESMISVAKGKGSMIGVTNRPTLLYFTLSHSACPVVAYVERGDKIRVTGTSGNPLDWEIEGNKLTEKLTRWRLDNKTLLMNYDSDSSAAGRAINDVVAKTIKELPEDPLSALLLGLYYNRREDPKGFEKLLKSLKGDAADQKWLSLISRADLIDMQSDSAFPDKVVLRSIFTGCDTVKFRSNPVMFVFSKPSDGSRAESIRRLRQLSRELNDSSRRVIVNMIVDADSLTALSTCRRDSLNGAVSVWTPLGLSDNVAVSVGARRLPWEVVVGRDGKPLYEGSDMAEAVKTMKEACR
ncbi:MAG: hypothetical protein HDS71_00635 [Bacteroidales bacterium]|nr:hypothetical protein [Bacteroidales bacterium]